jgi:hypothetical protein
MTGLWLLDAPLTAQKPPLDDILAAAAAYVTQLSERLQLVSAEEFYLQLETSGGQTRFTRRLVSDVVFVGLGKGRLHTFRDGFTKDGVKLREHDGRLVTLFSEQPSAALTRAQQWTDELAREYAGANLHLIDNVFAPLEVLRDENRARCTFSIESVKTTGGRQVAIVKFVESAVLRAIESPLQEPAFGRIHIEVGTGVVRQTELVLSDKLSNLRAAVTYKAESAIGVWLPSEMTLQTDISTASIGGGINQTQSIFGARQSLEGRATYSKFQLRPIDVRRLGEPRASTMKSHQGP